ncbi:MAG: extracellular solute-binding protein [Roseburia sp.]|nr:extracellular solute-binding protein [Roseburia sp.]
MKRWIAALLSATMVMSLAACGGQQSTAGSGGGSSSDAGGSSNAGGSGEKIVVWTLANDLKQFADRYMEETGKEVEVVVFDSADYSTKIMQTLGAKSTDVDIFVGEPQMLPNFFEAGFCADLSELESEVSTQLVDYTYEAGKDEDGVLRAVSYQATPGSVIYRCDLATEVFGTDDPEVIGEKFSSFDAIVDTAEQLHEKGYTIFGDTGALRWFSNSTSPWVKDGQIIVDQDRLDYFDTAVELYQKEYVAFAPEWSAAWYASMAGPLPMNAGWSALDEVDASNPETQVFSYVMPSWGALIVRDNAEDNTGKFGVCSGVCSFFGGGTFLTVNEYSQNKSDAVDFIRYCTLNDETAQWWLEASKGDVVSSLAVLEANKDYANPSFNNQHTYEFYAAELEKIDYSLITGYDDTCKEAFGAAIVSVQEGKQSKEDALKEFYTVVTTQYPELSIPDDAPIN